MSALGPLWPDCADLERVDEDAIRSPAQQPVEVRLAHRQRQVPDIVAIHGQHVEGAELDLGTMLAGTQGVEAPRWA